MSRSSASTANLTNGYTNGQGDATRDGQANGRADQQKGEDGILPSLSWSVPAKVSETADAGFRSFCLLPLSAHDEQALKASISKVSASLHDYDLANLLFTLSSRRSNFSRRAFVVLESKNKITTLDSDSFMFGKAPSSTAKRIGFIFTGQGAQWPQSESHVSNLPINHSPHGAKNLCARKTEPGPRSFKH